MLYLLHSSKNPVSLLTISFISFSVKVSLGRACNDYNVTFLCWCEMTNLSVTFLFPKLFHGIDRRHQIYLKSLWCDSWDIQVKVYLVVSSCPVLVLAFAWQLFSSLHLRLAPFLGSLIVLQLHNWSSKFWKSTVLDSAKPFGWICFFCCQSYLRECVSRRGLLHYGEGLLFVLR